MSAVRRRQLLLLCAVLPTAPLAVTAVRLVILVREDTGRTAVTTNSRRVISKTGDP